MAAKNIITPLGEWERISYSAAQPGDTISITASVAAKKKVDASAWRVGSAERVRVAGSRRFQVKLTDVDGEVTIGSPSTMCWRLVRPAVGEGVAEAIEGGALDTAPAAEVEAAVAELQADASSEVADAPETPEQPAEAPKRARSTGRGGPRSLDRSAALVVAYLEATGKPGERIKAAQQVAPKVAGGPATSDQVRHAVWSAGLMPGQKTQPSQATVDAVRKAVAERTGKTWRAVSKGGELVGRKAA